MLRAVRTTGGVPSMRGELRTRDAIYTAVSAWATLGIALQTLPTSEPVRLAAPTGYAVAALVTVVSLLQGGRRRGPA